MKRSQRLIAVLILVITLLTSYDNRANAFPRGNIRTSTDKQITGNVTTEDGSSLAGVNIVIKGTSTGVVSDANGNFSINVPEQGTILVFSSVGYVAKEVAVKGQKTIKVTLFVLKKDLNEVVVIGYGTTKKKDLTGAVSSIKGDEIAKSQPTTFDQALQGRAAGVQVTQMSGKPGAETSIRIRGTSSINAGNEPLYVIDGMVVSSDGDNTTTGVTIGPRISPLASINPNDIESIDILKDASSEAIYGSRGANGVVLITTKRGRAGVGLMNFDMFYGIQQLAHKVEVLNAADYAHLVNDAMLNANATPVYVNPLNLGVGTDWQNALYKKAPMASYQISFSGGDDKTKYSVSGGYFTQNGIIINSNYKRYSFRTNLDREVNKKLTIGNSLSYSNINSIGVQTDDGGSRQILPGVSEAALLFNPVLPVYDSSVTGGYTYENDGLTLGNPIADANYFSSLTKISRLLGNVYAKYKIAEGLEFKASFGIDQDITNEYSFGPAFIKREEASQGEASLGNVSGLSWLSENTLTYNKKYKNNDQLTLLGGFTAQQYNNETMLAYAFDFPDNRTGYNNIGAGLQPQPPYNNAFQWSLSSYLARANYSIQNKYLFTFTTRADGSSKFAQGNKWGIFPSGAFAWRVSNEKFLQNAKAISDLKLRVSYGVIGNQNIPPYQTLSLLTPTSVGVFNGNNPYLGMEPTSYVNKNLKWESTGELDLGVDASFFNNRLSATVDYYQKKTNNLLLSSPIPSTAGFTTTLLNIGNITNKGVDLDIHTTNIEGVFNWKTSLNISVNRNMVTHLDANDTTGVLSNGSLLKVGQPVGTFYGYVFDGIFQTDSAAAHSAVLPGQVAKAGDRKYKDLNGNGTIDANDRTILGNAQAKFTFGLNNSFSYKRIDFSFFFQGSVGNKMADLNLSNLLNFNGQQNVLKEAALNRWTPTNHSNEYPRALANSVDQGVFSSNIIEDASYLRLKNVTIAYNIPESALKKAKIKSLRFYASGSNLLTFTKYKGFDPEANTYGQNSFVVGFDYGGYPQAKTFTIGLNVGF